MKSQHISLPSHMLEEDQTNQHVSDDEEMQEEDEDELIDMNQNNLIENEEEDELVDFNALNENFDEEDNKENAEDIDEQQDPFDDQVEERILTENAQIPNTINRKSSERVNTHNDELENPIEPEITQSNKELQINNKESSKRAPETKRHDTNRSIEKNQNKEFTYRKNTNQTSSKEKENKFSNRNIKQDKNNANNEVNKVENDKLINFLLTSEILPKNISNNPNINSLTISKNKENSQEKKNTIQSIPRKANKYKHIKSNYSKEKLENDPNYKFGAEKFFINANMENPEFKQDMQCAVRKILSNNDSLEKDEDKLIKKLLLNDVNKKQIINIPQVTNSEIKSKVNYYINKKQKKLDEIENIKEEEFNKNCTFAPELISEKLFPEKRNLHAFIEDQKNHMKKINEKIIKIKEDDEKKIEELCKSEKMKGELYNTISNTDKNAQNENEINDIDENGNKEKGYIRLYNLRNKREKNDLLTNEKLLSGKTVKKKTLEERDKYLENLYKEGLIFMEKLEKDRNNRKKEEMSYSSMKNYAWGESNKIFLEKVMIIFRNAIKSCNIDSNNLYELDENNKFKEEEINIDRLDFTKSELKKFLFDIGFTLFDFSKDDNELSKIEDNNLSKKPNSKKIILKEEEKALVETFVENTLSNNNIKKLNSNDLFLYVIGILNLFDYFLYSSYKKTHGFKKSLHQSSNSTNKKPKVPKIDEEIKFKFSLINDIKEEIKKKANTQNRYSSYDQDKNLIITDENSHNLKKDFNLFYLNFMFKHNIQNSTQTLKLKAEKQFKEIATFKPSIDQNSKKLYSDYRRKIILNEAYDPNNPNDIKEKKIKDHDDYINNLILRQKRKENENALILEKMKQEELKDCTFKPKLESSYVSRRDNKDQENRLEQLYNIGKNLLLNKKANSKDDLEDENLKGCTFKPDLNKPDIKDFTNKKISNDIFNEKSYELLYKRLKEGRLERLIKDSVHDRGNFPTEINLYKNKIQDKNLKVNEMNNTTNILNNNTKSSEKISNISNGKISNSLFNNSSSQINSEDNDIFNNDPEKKDAIPLLIIDVNIRPGVKKKIYVYDGDTSEALAERFSKEHELDNETKNKLQGLIQSHMSKLLMRIDEENQSVSEKSSTYNLT